jgi:hypothetical protein
MATSRLQVPREDIERASKDDWAKYVSTTCVHTCLSAFLTSEHFNIISSVPLLYAFAPPPLHSAFARIENHYFINEGFMRQGQLLEKQEIDKM